MSPGQHAWPILPHVVPASLVQPPPPVQVKVPPPPQDPPLATQLRESGLQHPPALQLLPSQQG
jgi:hypothetical protein